MVTYDDESFDFKLGDELINEQTKELRKVMWESHGASSLADYYPKDFKDKKVAGKPKVATFILPNEIWYARGWRRIISKKKSVRAINTVNVTIKDGRLIIECPGEVQFDSVESSDRFGKLVQDGLIEILAFVNFK